MKAVKPTTARKSGGFFFAALLAVILAVFFWKSFLPGYVHFANDGPLGQQNGKWLQLPGAFIGGWDDLNDIGMNAGSSSLGLSSLIRWMLGPVGFSKFFAPSALFVLGLGAWAFFRQLKLSPLAAALGALATALNSTFFAQACWGVSSETIAVGMDFFALALIVASSSATTPLICGARLALAGMAVGVSVIEGVDNGALFSLFVAAFALFNALMAENKGGGFLTAKFARGIGHVAIIAVFAGFIATQTVVSLVGSQITGIAGTGQDAKTKAAHWDWATQWSEPKKEAISLFVPGLFGYKMDTPKGMMSFFQDAYKGGEYWGGVGRDPAIDRFFDSGQTGNPPQGFMRFTGGGNYCGVLVVLIAAWALVQSLRRRNSVFGETQRRWLWFWSAVMVVSLLLAFGRFAPFYKFLYMLPYFSTIRNPVKFIAIFSWAAVIVFAYGMHGLSRRYLEVPATGSASPLMQLKNWWAKVRDFDRNWTSFCVVAVIGSVFVWLIYALQKPSLVHYLQTVGFDENTQDINYRPSTIAAFSIRQAGWFSVIFALAAALCILILAGIFAGKRIRLGSILLGLFIVADLGRADLPYIIHWDYIQKYDIDPSNPANSTNPILNFLRDKPYEHRVAILPFDAQQQLRGYDDWFGGSGLYRIEWAQHHFPYYNIQSLDIVEMSRVAADLAAFDDALRIGVKQDGSGQWVTDPETFYRFGRLWELTNTRYLLGPAGYLDVMNQQLDPVQHRFRIAQRFDVVAKPGIAQPTGLEELTAAPSSDGDLALFEFTGALPRARLYTDWQTNSSAALKNFTTNGLSADDLQIFSKAGTNGFLTLKKLASPSFDPQQTVLLDAPLPEANSGAPANQSSGKVEFASYAPKDIVLSAQAVAPSVLLLNDKFDPNWRVLVDGKPAELLRCNFIMRGVYLMPGAHRVEFQFSPPDKPFFVTLAAIGVGVLLCGFLIFSGRRNSRTRVQP